MFRTMQDVNRVYEHDGEVGGDGPCVLGMERKSPVAGTVDSKGS